MTDHKFEEEKVKKALRCCAQPDPICKECPYYDPYLKYPCADQLKWAALNLIDRQKAEIERLQKLGAAATRRLVEVKAEANKEIERMKEEANKYPCKVRMNENSIVRSKSLEDYDRLIGDISAEAIKEFAERLKTKSKKRVSDSYGARIYVQDIDNLVKEMTGGASDEL